MVRNLQAVEDQAYVNFSVKPKGNVYPTSATNRIQTLGAALA